MNRLWGVSFAGLVLASCSSTTSTPGGSAGASGSGGGSSTGTSGSANTAGSAGHADGEAGANSAAQGGANAGVGGSSAAGKGSGGASGGNAGASAGAAGSSGAAGASGASGGGSGKAGGGGTSGAAGASSGGSAGAPAKYCDTHALASAPFTVTDHFDDEYVGDASNQVTEYALPDVCDEPAEANAVGNCAEWQYTPKATGGTTVKLQWLSDPIGVKYAPTCLAPGMTRITFAAKGKVGGEKLTFGASQATPIVVTLTSSWTQYSISLSGVNYNSDVLGVQPGFFWQTDPANGTIRFALDDIKYVNN